MRQRTGRRVLGAGVIAASLLVGCLGPAQAGPAASPNRLVTITIPDRRGEIPSKWLSYPGPPRAHVLLPAHYNPHQRYPLLVLLHGLESNYDWWVQSGLVAEFYGLDAIVVMPEGGSGWYTDWWNDGRRGSPAWESYELDEVLPAILARYPILPERRYHALAGISMGGLGSTYLGGRLPGFFGSVASLSGFVDPQFFAPITQPGMGLTSLAPLKGDDNLDPVNGPPGGFYADGHDPTRLVMNLQYTRLFESTGTGAPSDAAQVDPTGSVLESLVIYPMSQLYDRALRGAGIDVTYQVHPGGHDNPNFAAEIKAMLAWGLFKPVEEAPTSWVNNTVATSGQIWGIGFRFAKPPNAVVQFRQTGRSLAVSSAGSAVTITTSAGCVLHLPTPVVVQLPSHCP
jgi:S-formylglutathione hydrolase FrmB